jgi:hypothetical protein
MTKLYITRFEDGTVRCDKIIYPNHTAVFFSEQAGRIDMSGFQDHIGEPLKIYEKGKDPKSYTITGFTRDENGIGCVEYDPIK